MYPPKKPWEGFSLMRIRSQPWPARLKAGRVQLTAADFPKMDKGALGWMIKFAHKNYWRMASWLDMDDLLQEGYAAYAEVAQRYPTAIEPQHRMRLFQLVLHSRIEDLAMARTKQPDSCLSDVTLEEGEESQFEIADPEFSSIVAAAKEVPSIEAVLRLFTDNDSLKQLNAVYRKRLNGHRETVNERLCRLTEFDDIETRINEGTATATQVLIWAFRSAGLINRPVSLVDAVKEHFSP